MAFGDIANTASRIEQLNKRLGTRLLATEEVVSGLHDILVRQLIDFLLAAKRSAISVVEILSTVERASMAQLSLCARFQSAIDAFRGSGGTRPSHTSRAYPDDGPARFYLDQRLPDARQMAAPVSASPAVIGGEAVQ